MKRVRLLSAALVPALALYGLLAWKFNFLCDDAYISFRYARNAALGHGLRYNLELGPPVEGYSNYLWVVLMSWVARAGLDVLIWSRIISALCGALLLTWVTTHVQRRLDLTTIGTAACALFLASLPPLGLWATSGLAAMPFALFVFGTYERLLGDPERPRGVQAGLLAAGAGLVRADGSVWVLLILATGAVLWWQGGRSRKLARALLQTALIVAVVVGAHVGWRHGYYGDYLPNTARVKAGVSRIRLQRGFDYVVSYLLTLPALTLTLLLGLGCWRGGLWRHVVPALVLVGGTFVYATWVGGDFMPMGRFLLPIVPFSALLCACLWRRFGARWAGPFVGACVALNLAVSFNLPVVPDALIARFHFRTDRAWEGEVDKFHRMKKRNDERVVQGKALAMFVKPGESMIMGAIGALGYYSNLEIYDLYGLVSPSVIAASEPLEKASPGHDRRVDYPFFFDRHPTYLGNVIAEASVPVKDRLPDHWNRRLGKLADVERYEIPTDTGLPAGLELLLLRFARWEIE